MLLLDIKSVVTICQFTLPVTEQCHGMENIVVFNEKEKDCVFFLLLTFIFYSLCIKLKHAEI